MHVKSKKKMIMPSVKSDYNAIDSYKPKGNLIYNKSNINDLTSKTNNLLR